MKISKKEEPKRNLIAVIAASKSGIYFASAANEYKSHLVGVNGKVIGSDRSLSYHADGEGATPVYEGEEITIKF